MSGHTRLFGLYLPGSSVVHRWPTSVKYLIMFGLGIMPFIVANLWISAGALLLTIVLLIGLARLPVRVSLGLPWAFWAAMGLLIAYHGLFTTWHDGLLYLLNLLVALYLARLLTMTTPVSSLMDAIAGAARPLRLFGLDPDRVALAFAVMWRSIPYLLGSIGQVRSAARARGLERSVLRFVIPVIIGSVGYGLSTGDALRARGLDERADSRHA